MTTKLARKDTIVQARFQSPSSLVVCFDDQMQFELPVSRIEIDGVHWNTAAASPTGEAVLVTDDDGTEIPIDAATLRYLADPDYAKEVDDAIEELHLPQCELRKMLPHCQPPEEWHEEDHSGLLE